MCWFVYPAFVGLGLGVLFGIIQAWRILFPDPDEPWDGFD